MSRPIVQSNSSTTGWNMCPGCSYPQSANGFCFRCQAQGYHLAAYHVARWLAPRWTPSALKEPTP